MEPIESLKRTAMWSIFAVALIGFVFGTATGISLHSTLSPCPVATPRPSPTAAVIVAQCDTDTDCMEKFGCGGYADPCELPPITNTQLDSYCRKHPKARACESFCMRVDCKE